MLPVVSFICLELVLSWPCTPPKVCQLLDLLQKPISFSWYWGEFRRKVSNWNSWAWFCMNRPRSAWTVSFPDFHLFLYLENHCGNKELLHMKCNRIFPEVPMTFLEMPQTEKWCLAPSDAHSVWNGKCGCGSSLFLFLTGCCFAFHRAQPSS